MALLTKESLWLSGKAASEGGIRRSEVRFLIGLVTWRKTTFLYNALQNAKLDQPNASIALLTEAITSDSDTYSSVL